MRSNRLYVARFGIVVVAIAGALQDVVATADRRLRHPGRRATAAHLGRVDLATRHQRGRHRGDGGRHGCHAGHDGGLGDIFANEQIYVGLASGLVVYVVGSLISEPTAPEVLVAGCGIDAVARSKPRDATMW